MFNQGLGQPTSDNNLFVHALFERKHPIACPTDVFPEVLILVNQPIKDVKDSLFFFSCFLLLFRFPQASNRGYINKKGMRLMCSCPLLSR